MNLTKITPFLLAMLLTTAAIAQALLPAPPGMEKNILAGTISLIGCEAELAQVSVRVQPGDRLTHPYKLQRQYDGSILMDFKVYIGANEEHVPYKLSIVPPPSCSGASIAPSQVTVPRMPAASPAFQVQVPMERYSVALPEMVAMINLMMSTVDLQLNNYRRQSSFLSIGNERRSFTINPTRVDLDCGLACPDLGDAVYYVNDVSLEGGTVARQGRRLLSTFNFESDGTELKGHHNSLGDNGAPDFHINNLSISSEPVLTVRRDGRLDLLFLKTKVSGNVASTGGCSPFGIDLCDLLFGTDGIIKGAIQTSVSTTLNSGNTRAEMATQIQQQLNAIGLRGRIFYYRLTGDTLEIYTKN